MISKSTLKPFIIAFNRFPEASHIPILNKNVYNKPDFFQRFFHFSYNVIKQLNHNILGCIE